MTSEAYEGSFYLELPNEKFECRAISMTWQMMRFTKAKSEASRELPTDKDSDRYKSALRKRSDAALGMFEVLYDMAMMVLQPHERDRFIEYMSTAELDNGILETAIITAVNGATSEGGDVGKAQEKSLPSSSSPSTENGNAPDISYSQVLDNLDTAHP